MWVDGSLYCFIFDRCVDVWDGYLFYIKISRYHNVNGNLNCNITALAIEMIDLYQCSR